MPTDRTNNSLQVAALENGTVIDHIPPAQLFRAIHLLDLENSPNQVTFGNNFLSKRMGTKGIIKIESKYFSKEELNRLALIAPMAKINIIKNYKVVEKLSLSLPDEIHSLIKCINPNCISNNEPMATRFTSIAKEPVMVKCHYCEHEISAQEIIIL